LFAASILDIEKGLRYIDVGNNVFTQQSCGEKTEVILSCFPRIALPNSRGPETAPCLYLHHDFSASEMPRLFRIASGSGSRAIVSLHKSGRTQEAQGRTQEAQGRTQEAQGRTQEAQGRTQEAFKLCLLCFWLVLLVFLPIQSRSESNITVGQKSITNTFVGQVPGI
jgi:hypothetical protein